MGERRYIPQLDGLRAVAALLIVQHHVDIPGIEGGFIGVPIFFTLSGFVITSLLKAELEAHGWIRLRRFFMRRLVRLYPAMVLGVVLAVIVAGSTGVFTADTRSSWWIALLYMTNVQRWLGDSGGLLSHYWSLASEAQFYAIWPLVLLLLARRNARRIAAIAVAGAVLCWALTVGNHLGLGPAGSEDLTYYFPAFSAIGLMCGAVVAAIPARRPPVVLVALALAVLVAATLRANVTELGMYVVGFPIVFVASAVLIAHLAPQDSRGRLSRLLAHPTAVWLGQRSYGIYVYHLPVVAVFQDLPLLPRAVAVFAATLAAAALSWRYVERPLLHRGGSLRGRVTATEGSAG